MKVSLVSVCTQTTNLKTVELDYVFDKIKNGSAQSSLIRKIKDLAAAGASDDVVTAEKQKLPAIMFHGTFKRRERTGLIESSGLMVLDFDKLHNGSVAALKENKFIYSLFKSPSGRGYKALVRIPKVKNDEEFKSYFGAIQEEFTDVDQSGKDISRLCFLSEDADLYVNENSEIWTKKKVVIEVPKFTANRISTSDLNLTKVPINMILNSIIGNRHDTMLRAGQLVGGYIAAKRLNEQEILPIFKTHIEYHSGQDFTDHFRAFKDGIEYGKKTPLTAKEIEEITLEDKLGRIHLTVDEVMDKMDYVWEHGRQKGYKVGWKEFDDLYSLNLGSTTYIYSSPYTGKTQFWHECLINLSQFYGMRHAIFSPETGDAAELFMELAQIYSRQDFDGDYKMSEQQKNISYAFIREHFICIDSDSFEKDLTVMDICDYVTMLELKYNTKIHTLTIDPYNELKHDKKESRDLVLEDELKYIRRSAKNNDRHICVITHVTEQEKRVDKDTQATYYHIPTFREIAGGQTWSRKGMMMIAVWRPLVMKKGGDNQIVEIGGRVLKTNQLIIQVQKAKPKGYGKTGEMNLYYDWQKHSYYDDNNNHALMPKTNAEPIQEKIIEDDELEPNPF